MNRKKLFLQVFLLILVFHELSTINYQLHSYTNMGSNGIGDIELGWTGKSLSLAGIGKTVPAEAFGTYINSVGFLEPGQGKEKRNLSVTGGLVSLYERRVHPDSKYITSSVDYYRLNSLSFYLPFGKGFSFMFSRFPRLDYSFNYFESLDRDRGEGTAPGYDLYSAAGALNSYDLALSFKASKFSFGVSYLANAGEQNGKNMFRIENSDGSDTYHRYIVKKTMEGGSYSFGLGLKFSSRISGFMSYESGYDLTMSSGITHYRNIDLLSAVSSEMVWTMPSSYAGGIGIAFDEIKGKLYFEYEKINYSEVKYRVTKIANILQPAASAALNYDDISVIRLAFDLGLKDNSFLRWGFLVLPEYGGSKEFNSFFSLGLGLKIKYMTLDIGGLFGRRWFMDPRPNLVDSTKPETDSVESSLKKLLLTVSAEF